ncbi:MAG: hypothetical protein J6S23_01535 [Clostridia bacterium]|nr:hypothetical protein [Clostridia bacterium]
MLGKADGELISKALDIRQGIKLAKAHLLLAMAYVNEKDDGTAYLSKPKFAEFYLELEKTFDKFIEDSINGEDGLDTYDIADLHVGHDSFIRKRYGLPEGDYDQIIKR